MSSSADIEWHTTETSPLPSPVPWKKYAGELCPHGLQIMLVDGTHVRNHFDSDFSQGGNGRRYRFVPKGEIWIDWEIDPTEWPYIAFHECVEEDLMRRGHLDYDRAHARAKRREDKLRRSPS